MLTRIAAACIRGCCSLDEARFFIEDWSAIKSYPLCDGRRYEFEHGPTDGAKPVLLWLARVLGWVSLVVGFVPDWYLRNFGGPKWQVE